MKSLSKANPRLRFASRSSKSIPSKARRPTADPHQASRFSNTQLLTQERGASSIFSKPVLGSTFICAAQAVTQLESKPQPAARFPLPSIDLSLLSLALDDQPPEIDEIQELVSSIDGRAEVSEVLSDLDGFLLQNNIEEEVKRLASELQELKVKVNARDQQIKLLTRQVQEKEVALQILKKTHHRNRGWSPSIAKRFRNS